MRRSLFSPGAGAPRSDPVVTSGIGRLATGIAVVALLLNALLLGWAGLVAGRLVLVGAAVLSLVGAVVVILAWRRHLRTLDELTAARQELRDEARALRDLLRSDRE